MLVHRGARYRIYPSPAQVVRLEAWEHALRWLWNHAHTERVAKLEAGFWLPSAFDQINDLTALRASLPWLADVPRDVCAQTLVELDKAWQKFFKKIAGLPRYKHKRRSERAPMIAPQAFRVEGEDRRGSIVFPKLGAIHAVIHRSVRGKAKTCAIVRDGKAWFACVSTEFDVPEPTVSTKPPIGLDRGVAKLIADSDGGFVENPRPFKRIQGRLATAQRRVARKMKGSQNQKRARARVSVLYRKARRQREAVLHRESKRYAENQGVLVVERLDIGNMTKSARGTVDSPGKNVRQKAGLNRAILDSGWGRFVQMLRYKSELTGARVVEVPAAYSSQTCSECGHVSAESRRSQSQFECVACGHRDHADTNAAKVILSRETHGDEGCEGDGSTRPAKQQLRVVRRATRHVDPGYLSLAEAPAFMPG